MTVAQFLWGWAWGTGLVALICVIPAFAHARATQTRGRLIATLLVLVGIDLNAAQRMFDNAPLHGVIVVGLPLVDVGLLGYVLFLPDTGVLAAAAWVRRRYWWRERGGGDQ